MADRDVEVDLLATVGEAAPDLLGVGRNEGRVRQGVLRHDPVEVGLLESLRHRQHDMQRVCDLPHDVQAVDPDVRAVGVGDGEELTLEVAEDDEDAAEELPLRQHAPRPEPDHARLVHDDERAGDLPVDLLVEHVGQRHAAGHQPTRHVRLRHGDDPLLRVAPLPLADDLQLEHRLACPGPARHQRAAVVDDDVREHPRHGLAPRLAREVALADKLGDHVAEVVAHFHLVKEPLRPARLFDHVLQPVALVLADDRPRLRLPELPVLRLVDLRALWHQLRRGRLHLEDGQSWGVLRGHRQVRLAAEEDAVRHPAENLDVRRHEK